MSVNLDFTGGGEPEQTTDTNRDEFPDLAQHQWKAYEDAVRRIFREKVRNGTRMSGTHVEGLYSGIPRQIDVLMTSHPVDDIETVIVVECKRYKARVGIGTVDEFYGKLVDVGAQHGVLCAPSGFTAGARKRANHKMRPTILLVDLGTDVEQLDLSMFDVEFDCPAYGCNWGSLSWGLVESDSGDRVGVGHCDRCGGLAVRCETCGDVEEPGLGFECGCSCTFEAVNDHHGEFDAIVRTDGHGDETVFDRWVNEAAG